MNMSSPSTPVTSLRAFYRTVWIVQTAGIWLQDQWCKTPDFLSAVGCCGDEMEHQSNKKDPLAADESHVLSSHVRSVGEFWHKSSSLFVSFHFTFTELLLALLDPSYCSMKGYYVNLQQTGDRSHQFMKLRSHFKHCLCCFLYFLSCYRCLCLLWFYCSRCRSNHRSSKLTVQIWAGYFLLQEQPIHHPSLIRTEQFKRWMSE